MSRIVVTGASGFLGRYTCADLTAAGHDVVAVGRGPNGDLVELETRRADGIFDEVDAVVHLAGALAKGHGTPVSDYLAANVQLPESVLLRCVAGGATKFVFSSSRLVYRSDLGRPATEADAPQPETAYGLSKLFAERVIEHQTKLNGIRSTSLRISQLVGAGDGDRGVLASFARAAAARQPLQVGGSGAATRDFLDVRDAARAIRLSLDAMSVGHPPSALNVGGGGRTILELAQIACESFGMPETLIEHVPTDVEDTSHWSLDSTLARNTIGWQPQATLVEALRHRWAVQ